MKNTFDGKLALLGGQPAIKKEFKKYNPIGAEEVSAGLEVLKSGMLSNFVGAWDPDFYGGPQVQKFERHLEKYFNVNHAITFNSWTSGLIAAVGAIGIEPGDEVIVCPWTMSASAIAILHWNAIPIFADIDPDTFCIDPESVRRNISNKTKAIMAVDIAGQSAPIDDLLKICVEFDIKLISDTAQAPGAHYKEKYAGTLAHIGGFSLNFHKHIHTGEGGIAVTEDDELAEKMRLIRNHAEVVVAGKNQKDLVNMIGYNFRLGEIEAAIGIEQIQKLKEKVDSRIRIASLLYEGLINLRGLTLPKIRSECTHVYYVFSMKIDQNVTNVSRDKIAEALRSEGVPALANRYQNLHLLPMFQKKVAYGKSGFPWTADFTRKDIDYGKGICPVAEYLQDKAFMGLGMCDFDLTEEDVGLIVIAFQKVWENLEKISDL